FVYSTIAVDPPPQISLRVAHSTSNNAAPDIYSLAGSDNENPPPPQTPTQQAPHTVSTIKLLILKKGVSTEDANQKFLGLYMLPGPKYP
ncbi:hypothetical protein Tco_1422492, partial [Tanacetum coccineum]